MISQQFKKIFLNNPFSLFSQIKYVRGFRNTHAQEIQEGYLPKHTNPKNPPHNLITEQFTGPGGFTGEALTGGPLRLWLYKFNRSVRHSRYEQCDTQPFHVEYFSSGMDPIRINPKVELSKNQDFVQGLKPFADNDHIYHYNYSLNQSMSESKSVFHNTDGEILLQPSVGCIQILTECGILEIQPGTIGVIPKNMKFQVNLQESQQVAYGVITELKYDRSFILPLKGPIGANGLANSEDFYSPVPFVDEQNLQHKHTLICKKQNTLLQAEVETSPFDVYAWKGNYMPYKFALDDFIPIVPANRDHLDPSSHLILAVNAENGVNFVELVVFAPRWNCTSDKYPTYLPPYDHRNNGKSEIMHYLGRYDARVGSLPGSQTLHDMGSSHGNDQDTFEKSRSGENKTIYLDNPFATMIELTGYCNVTKDVLEQQDFQYKETFLEKR